MSTPEPAQPPVANLDLKATILLITMLLLVSGTVLYVLYARGVFDATQRLVLIAENTEGVVVGMDLTFAGFPIGRVRGIELGAEGNARILIDVPRKDAGWLRTSSVYTLERGLLGNTSLRAFTGIPTDPPLPDDAEKTVLIGDASAEIPRMAIAVRELVDNLSALSADEAPLAMALTNLQSVSEKLKGRHGVLGVLMGNDADAGKIVKILERSQALLARADQAVARVDGLVARTDQLIARADTQVLGEDGLLREVRNTIIQLNNVLGDARNTLKSAESVLGEVQGVATNARTATTDLGVLRADVEANLRKVEHLLDEIYRRWPFTRDTEIRLP